MKRLHIAVSVLLIVSGLAYLIGIEARYPPVVFFSGVGLELVTLAAIAIALVLVIFLVIRGIARKTLVFSFWDWLGVINGIFAMGVWALAIINSSEPEYPIIHADLAGSEASFKVKSGGDKWGWNAYLELMFDPKNPEDLLRVEKIAHSFNASQTGETQYERNSLHLLLNVFKITGTGEELIESEEVNSEKNIGHTARGYILSLHMFRLPWGEYVIRIKMLNANPSLTGTSVRFYVGQRWE